MVSANKKDKKDKVEQIIKETNAPKRPETLDCDILRFNNHKEKWIGFIGLNKNGKPYEVFTGLLENFNVPIYVEKGKIRRVKTKEMKESRYDFIYKDKDGFEQEMKGLSRAFNREYWNIAKMVSGVIRHGMPLPNVINLIDSLNFGDNDTIVSWKVGLKRMLKQYIDDGTVEEKGEKCSNCGAILVFSEGCKKCLQCGNSKCG